MSFSNMFFICMADDPSFLLDFVDLLDEEGAVVGVGFQAVEQAQLVTVVFAG